MKIHQKFIVSLVLIGLSIKVNAADFAINENTKIQELKNVLGSPVRSLLSEKKDADFLDETKYTFLDLYNANFGVVVVGIHPVFYHLANKIGDEQSQQLLGLKETSIDNISLLGIKLGENFNQAQHFIQALPNFEKFATASHGQGVEYHFVDGSRVILRSDANNQVADVELFLK